MFNKGDVIDGVWVVEEPLGKGGMASVYRCHNAHAGRILAAIKILSEALSGREDVKSRFVREAELLFSLDHPHIVKVRNVRLEASPPYLEMEFVEGQGLNIRLRQGGLDTYRTMVLTEQLCSAVGYLHRKGIFHRDIKPANLILQKNGQLKLVDFGLALEARGDQITVGDMAFGTVSYAPPEWIKAGPVDPRTWDIYAIGVVCYEMLTGRLAFPVEKTAGPRQQALRVMGVKQELDHLDPGEAFPESIRNLIRSMTNRFPERRPETVRECLARVQSSLKDIDTDAVTHVGLGMSRPPPIPDSPPPSPPREEATTAGEAPARAWGTMVLLVSAVAVAVLALLALAWVLLRPGTTRDVQVVVAGVGRDVEVGVRVGGLMPSRRDGFTYGFSQVPVGDVPIAWATGDGCATLACPGDSCPSWCGTGVTTIPIGEGKGTQTVSLEVATAEPVSVTVQAAGAEQARLGTDSVTVEDGEAVFDAVAPGPKTLVLQAGTCEETVGSCAPAETCPPGCSRLEEDVVIPASGPVLLDFELPEPEREAAPAPRPVPTAPSPKPDPQPPTANTRQPVTGTTFAAWLSRNPRWQQDAAIADGNADSNYLSGFNPANPSTGPMVNVSWRAANAFCSGRGGLRELRAKPRSWTESADQPFQEWRVAADGAPAWRRFDGAESLAVSGHESNAFTGFRCKN